MQISKNVRSHCVVLSLIENRTSSEGHEWSWVVLQKSQL